MKLRTTPLAAYEEMLDVARRRDAIPTDKDIADKYGLTRSYVQQLMHRIRKNIDKKAYVSRGTTLVLDGSHDHVPSILEKSDGHV